MRLVFPPLLGIIAGFAGAQPGSAYGGNGVDFGYQWEVTADDGDIIKD
jgi:hypothetical protein